VVRSGSPYRTPPKPLQCSHTEPRCSIDHGAGLAPTALKLYEAHAHGGARLHLIMTLYLTLAMGSTTIWTVQRNTPKCKKAQISKKIGGSHGSPNFCCKHVRTWLSHRASPQTLSPLPAAHVAQDLFRSGASGTTRRDFAVFVSATTSSPSTQAKVPRSRNSWGLKINIGRSVDSIHSAVNPPTVILRSLAGRLVRSRALTSAALTRASLALLQKTVSRQLAPSSSVWRMCTCQRPSARRMGLGPRCCLVVSWYSKHRAHL
jgi:hypothetical protein